MLRYEVNFNEWNNCFECRIEKRSEDGKILIDYYESRFSSMIFWKQRLQILMRLNRESHKLDTFFMKKIGGHISFDLFGYDVTIYGWNAMLFAWNIRLKNGLILCLRPPNFCYFRYISWYIYLSPDGTPSNAVWGKSGKGGIDSYHHENAFKKGKKSA